MWTTDKDGIILGLLAAEITAVTGQGSGEIYRRPDAGSSALRCMSASMRRRPRIRKRFCRSCLPMRSRRTELAGDPIDAMMTTRARQWSADRWVESLYRRGWFAARPSGTENVYKIYAESFVGEDHLRRIQSEAQAIVSSVVAARPVTPER